MILKKLLARSNYWLNIVIVIGILVVLNFFSYNIFYRYDLTQNKDYSLSRASKQTVADLKDIVNLKVYFSANLPSQYINLRQEVADILDEYSNYSSGKVKVEFIDPQADAASQQELAVAGIPQLQFNVLEKDKYQVVNGYLGIAIKYGDRLQAIPVVENTRDLEYQITSAIKKLTDDQIAKIAFWQGNQTASTDEEISIAFKKLSEIYAVTALDFAQTKVIPADINTLIIINPKQTFTEDELKAIDSFLMRGGGLMIAADGVTVDQGLQSNKNEIGLNKILESYGLRLNNNLVLDINNGLASFNQGYMTFTTNYPYWPKVVSSGFDQNNAAVAKLEGLVLPWASSVDILNDKIGDLTVSSLAATTDRAVALTDNFDLSPQAQIDSGATGRYILAAALSGRMKSAYGGQSQAPGRLILVGDSDFINDGFLRIYPDNLLFFQNLVDSLSLSGDLIAIRSKGVTERPLKDVSESVKNTIRYANIFSLTIVVLLFGMARYYFRRRMKFTDAI